LEKKARFQPPLLITSREQPKAAVARKSEKPRKLTFKEQKELEGMEGAIQEAEQKIADLEALFLEPDFHRRHGHRTAEIQSDLASAKDHAAKLYARWEELEAIRAASGRP
ncbi:MAG TPA: ABC transporter C-terminal domain-containing protein, partial [Verrucomicrobiae bacterium]